MLKQLAGLFFAAASLPAHAVEVSAIPFKTIDGKETSLAAWQGKVVLIVNTASKCGLTKQYEGLENLQKKYGSKGFTVIGFPCNDFAGQEPGTTEEIQKFCKLNYGVTFPLMEKIHVKGPDQHPLYAALTGPQGAFPGEVKWNFGKFLIGKDGKPVIRFEPKQAPENAEVIAAIERELAK